MRFINLREDPDIIQAMLKGGLGDDEAVYSQVTAILQSGDIQVKVSGSDKSLGNIPKF